MSVAQATPVVRRLLPSRRRVIQLAGLAVLVVVIGFQRHVLASSLGALRHFRWQWLPLILMAEFASMAAAARAHRYLLRSSGEATLSFRSVLAITYASNAIAVTLPLAGSGVATGFTFREFRRTGAEAAAASWALIVSGIAATAAFGVLLVAGFAATGHIGGLVTAVAGAVGAAVPPVLLLVALKRPTFRARLERAVIAVLRKVQRRTPLRDSDPEKVVTDLVEGLGQLRLSRRVGSSVLALSVWNWTADLLCLIAAMKAVGASIPWHGVLLAYLIGMSAGSLNVTPGGIGVIEVVLTGGLVADGLPARLALAAVLVYRLVSLWLVAAIGWVVFAWRAGHGQLPVTAATEDPLPLVGLTVDLVEREVRAELAEDAHVVPDQLLGGAVSPTT